MADNEQPEGPDLMGYDSVEALVQAKRASDQEAKRLADENRRYGERLDALERQAVNQSRTVPQRGTARDRLAELAIPVDAIDEMMSERIGTAIQQAFEPIAKGFKARNEMLAEHPEFAKFEADVAAFVHNDPEVGERYNRIYSVDPLAANKYAYLEFGAREQKKPRNSRNSTREEAAHAAIPTERSGESRHRPDDSELTEAMQQVRDSGRSRDAVERYAKLRLKKTISDEFLNQ